MDKKALTTVLSHHVVPEQIDPDTVRALLRATVTDVGPVC